MTTKRFRQKQVLATGQGSLDDYALAAILRSAKLLPLTKKIVKSAATLRKEIELGRKRGCCGGTVRPVMRPSPPRLGGGAGAGFRCGVWPRLPFRLRQGEHRALTAGSFAKRVKFLNEKRL